MPTEVGTQNWTPVFDQRLLWIKYFAIKIDRTAFELDNFLLEPAAVSVGPCLSVPNACAHLVWAAITAADSAYVMLVNDDRGEIAGYRKAFDVGMGLGTG